MSKLVCRMKKVKKNDVRGYQIHNLRELDSKTNPDIDKSLERLNKDFVNAERINFMEKWKETFESQNTSKRALRKDAVYYNEFILGSDKQFFEKLNQNEKDRFFKVATDFFKERYGEQNVLYSIAHYDETRGAGAHAHLAVVPMRDGKLQSKNVFDRNELRYLQDELPKTLQRAGFDIERGQEGSKAKHIETATYKMMNAQKLEREATMDISYAKQTVEILNEQIQDLSVAVEEIKDIERIQYDFRKNWLGKETDEVFLNREDFDQIKYYAEDRAKVVTNLQKKKRENNFLMREVAKLEQEKKQYSEKNDELELRLYQQKSNVDQLVKERFKEQMESMTRELENMKIKIHGIESHYKEKLDEEIEKVSKDKRLMERNYESKLEKLDKTMAIVESNLVSTKDYNNWLEREVSDRDRKIEDLESKLIDLQNRFVRYKEKAVEDFKTLVTKSGKFIQRAMTAATREWIRENSKELSYKHLEDENKIVKRSNEIHDDLFFKEIAQKKNIDLER